MAFINYATNNLAIKIVYYGPGLSGKTTNLRYIYLKLDPESRGEFVCLETATDRTFFFDLLPIRAGMINDFQIHFQLLTVPGQVFYEASRKTVMRGADGIVFVADSQVALLDANIESFDGLRKNLLENDMDLNDLPNFLEPLVKGEADYTKGNRFLYAGDEKEIARPDVMPFKRLLGNSLLSSMVKFASGYYRIFDTQDGYTAITSEAIRRVNWNKAYKGYGYPGDFLIVLNTYGLRVKDVPRRAIYLKGERQSPTESEL